MNTFHYLPLTDDAAGWWTPTGCPCRVHLRPIRVTFSGRGFAAIELLVVLAVLAILTAVLAPALSRGRDRALTIQCLNNKRQLAIACQMYSAENNNYLVPNAPVSAYVMGRYLGWCPGQESWGAVRYNIDEEGYRTNGLGLYVNNVKVYKCPADTIPSDNGDRIRSISMSPAMIGDLEPLIGPTQYAQLASMLSGYQLFKKVTDLGCIGVSKAWIFCDESMYTLNDGYLQCNLKPSGSPGYPDVPAAYHGSGNCFSFADGHAEYKRWRYVAADPNAGILNCPYAKDVRGPGSGNSRITTGLDPDWQWLREHTSCPK